MRAKEVRTLANEAHKRLCDGEEPQSEVILLIGSIAINAARIADALEQMAFDEPPTD